MPDPRKLQSFLQRTQKAMQDAVNRGDQAAVDQYENFLDRGNAVGERFLQGQQGPGGEPGATGQPGQTQHVDTLVGGLNGSKLANDLENETSPSFTLTRSGGSPLQQMINGVPKAPEPKYTGPSSGMPEPITAPAGAPTIHPNLGNAADMGFIPPREDPGLGMKDFWGALPKTRPWIETTAKALMPHRQIQNLGESLKDLIFTDSKPATPLTAKAGTPTGTSASDPEFTHPDKDTPINIHDEETLPNAPQKNYADWWNQKNSAANQERADIGEEPKFFNLQRLAEILLMGAPAAYKDYQGEKQRFEDRKYKLQDRKYMESQQARDNNWHLIAQKMKNDTEERRAMATLLPELAKVEGKSALDVMAQKQKEIDAITTKIAATPEETARLPQLRAEAEAAKAQYDEIVQKHIGRFNPQKAK